MLDNIVFDSFIIVCIWNDTQLSIYYMRNVRELSPDEITASTLKKTENWKKPIKVNENPELIVRVASVFFYQKADRERERDYSHAYYVFSCPEKLMLDISYLSSFS